jgi:hypothetical protein
LIGGDDLLPAGAGQGGFYLGALRRCEYGGSHNTFSFEKS